MPDYLHLQERWIKFSTRTTIPNPHILWENFLVLYSEPDRHYHNLSHIEDCLLKLDHWTPLPSRTQRDIIELAIWFHDIIYETERNDNEESSAALTSYYLRGHPLTSKCNALILSTAHHAISAIKAEQIMCDIDLSILGATPEQYLKYSQNIRNEYSWVGTINYAEGRTRVLKKFLLRDNIYLTNHAKNKWEKQARINIQNELNNIEKSTPLTED